MGGRTSRPSSGSPRPASGVPAAIALMLLLLLPPAWGTGRRRVVEAVVGFVKAVKIALGRTSHANSWRCPRKPKNPFMHAGGSLLMPPSTPSVHRRLDRCTPGLCPQTTGRQTCNNDRGFSCCWLSEQGPRDSPSRSRCIADLARLAVAEPRPSLSHASDARNRLCTRLV